MPELAGVIEDENTQPEMELVQLETESKIESQNKLFNDIESTLNDGSNDFLSFLKQNKNEAKSQQLAQV